MNRSRTFRNLIGGFLLCLAMLSWPLVADIRFSEPFLKKIEEKHNRFSRLRFEEWQSLMDDATDLSEQEKLNAVNAFFNRNVQFIDDLALWGKKDYWATPAEMLAIGAGDCEDYSIAKYFTLKAIGIDEEKLRITYVKAIELDQAHMVLTYYETPRSMPLVLDNLVIDIEPANRRPDLIPVYSFNGRGLWLSKSRGTGQRVGDASRLSLWEDLVNRMQAEDF
ncbi:hypothetical protein Q7C_14 [Methylophaga frappieri]|uniref:Periplasmic protein n=1 Tax=Methylophaga frappieri (strain ATCC BAA-2434 / DSM 25690 / JAM7) TaxID=754477 RepID=I1YE56_METFJ|nr:transglutaminase-like cysteine peptidase [Methylophaga frappieri]AFJ01199.1 hypothetical protein Q7C_14 [Methylophaga frappieri]